MSEFKFVHNTTDSNLQNPISLSLCADLAYEDTAILEEKAKSGWGFSGCQFNEEFNNTRNLCIT